MIEQPNKQQPQQPYRAPYRPPTESWSRCETDRYSNIYDVRSHPEFKSVVKAAPVVKDTISISDEQLKQDALKHIAGFSRLVNKKNPAFRYVKFIFTGIVYTPYLLLFRLPKYVVTESIPVVESAVNWLWKAITNKIQKPAVIFVHQYWLNTLQYFQKVKNTMLRPITHCALGIQQFYRWLKERAFRGLEAAKKLIRFMQRPLNAFKKIGNRARNRVSDFGVQIVRDIKKIIEFMQYPIKWVQKLFHVINQFALSIIPKMGPFWKGWKIKLKESFKFPRNGAWEKAMTISRFFKHQKEMLLKELDPIISFYKEYIAPVAKKIKENGKKYWKQFKGFCGRNHEKALAFLKQKQEKLKRASSHDVLQAFLSHPWIARLPRFFKKWFNRIIPQKLSRICFIIGFNVYKGVAALLLTATASVLQLLSLASKFGLLGLNLINKGFSQVLQIIFQGIGFVCKHLQKVLFYALYYFLLFATIFTILLLWSVKGIAKSLETFAFEFAQKK